METNTKTENDLVQSRLLDKTDPVQLELFTNRFRAIAEEMGEMLRRTAISTNVKERLDFSCALLDTDGELVVNAPHMPVHLGALGICVRTVRDQIEMSRGDVIVTNHPKFGGSHLPDITMIMPVHTAHGELIGYVANRAHHAEIGGMSPGSMPPSAKTLDQEGVVIPPSYLLRGSTAYWANIEALLTKSKYPTRARSDNLADLRAALAANHRGATILQNLAEQYGKDSVTTHMTALKELAEKKVRAAIDRLPDGECLANDALDDGSPLQVRAMIKGDNVSFDFTGSAGVHPGNLNATEAIVRSVVIYVMRLLVNEPLPLNEGLMKPVDITLPTGLLNPHFPEDPRMAPAVVGGNIETSQRLVNLLLRAFRLTAASQGTMNNTLFGNRAFGYYETVCGGAGAGSYFDGASAVHTHMTNTRITDPEVLEHRYPVRLEQFAIRKGSGGAGRHRGGDGVIREITFLAPMSLSVLGQHRTQGPAGLAGGGAGSPGQHQVIRKSGEIIMLEPVDGCQVKAADRFLLKTPGGGGYGSIDDPETAKSGSLVE